MPLKWKKCTYQEHTPVYVANISGAIYMCASGGGDHKPCCRRSRVPEQCLGFCEGKPGQSHIGSFFCMQFIPMMISCFREGYGKLLWGKQAIYIDKGVLLLSKMNHTFQSFIYFCSQGIMNVDINNTQGKESCRYKQHSREGIM